MTVYGLDTNVVIRLLTHDDDRQRAAALRFGAGLGREYTAFLPLVAILELDWALRAKLGFSRRETLGAIGKLLHTRGLEIEHHDLVAQALALASSDNADLADALIAARAFKEGCRAVKTFDKRAAGRVPGMELLS